MKIKLIIFVLISLFLVVFTSCDDGSSSASGSNPGSEPFISIWKTDNTGASNDYQITIPTNGSGYNYNVDWGDGSTSEGITWGDITHTYSSPGLYTVKITGGFPRIDFYASGASTDRDKIISIESWGSIEWTSMEWAFFECNNLILNTSSIPDFSQLTSLESMFRGASSLQGLSIGNWDVSTVTSMNGMFYGATNFNGDVGDWNVSNVQNMGRMFQDTYYFNQDIGAWDVSKVTDMHCMFEGTEFFNQDLSSWNVSGVTTMWRMFNEALSFDGDITGWNVCNVTDMYRMFYHAISCGLDLSDWDVSSVNDHTEFADGGNDGIIEPSW